MNKQLMDRLLGKLIDDMAELDVEKEDAKPNLKPEINLDEEELEGEELAEEDEILPELTDEEEETMDDEEALDEELAPEEGDEPLALKKRFSKLTR